MFLNQRLEEGDSVRKVQIMRTVLSAALTRAVREELIVRNVARLAELPQCERGTIRPWSADEAKQFLAAAKPDPLYPAFVLLLLYGLRRGEVLGLCWSDIDLDAGTLHVRQQLQRIRGELHLGPVKTHAGQPWPPPARARPRGLELQSGQQAADRADDGPAWPDTETWCSPPGPAGRSSPGTWSGPSAASARTTRSDSSRSTTCGTQSDRCSKICRCRPRRPDDPRPHARISTTLEIYTDTDEEASRNALNRLHRLLDQSEN